MYIGVCLRESKIVQCFGSNSKENFSHLICRYVSTICMNLSIFLDFPTEIRLVINFTI